MAEIGNGSTKAISVILSNDDANNFIFGLTTFNNGKENWIIEIKKRYKNFKVYFFAKIRYS